MEFERGDCPPLPAPLPPPAPLAEILMAANTVSKSAVPGNMLRMVAEYAVKMTATTIADATAAGSAEYNESEAKSATWKSGKRYTWRLERMAGQPPIASQRT